MTHITVLENLNEANRSTVNIALQFLLNAQYSMSLKVDKQFKIYSTH